MKDQTGNGIIKSMPREIQERTYEAGCGKMGGVLKEAFQNGWALSMIACAMGEDCPAKLDNNYQDCFEKFNKAEQDPPDCPIYRRAEELRQSLNNALDIVDIAVYNLGKTVNFDIKALAKKYQGKK